MKQKPVTHNYTDSSRGWGHDRIIEPQGEDKLVAKITGWGPREGANIKPGDFLLFGEDKETLRAYRVDEISYYADLPDMWHGTAHFVRPNSEEILEVDQAVANDVWLKFSQDSATKGG